MKNNLYNKIKLIFNKSKNKTAIFFKNRISFKELDLKSDLICSYLYKNLNPGDKICITSKKNKDVFIILFSCLKLGVSVTFLDRKSPKSRNNKIIDTLKPKIIFLDSVLKKNIEKNKSDYININFYKKIKTNQYELKKFSKLAKNINNKNIAYTMFTSGSTGVPKGVEISQKNLLNFVNWVKEEYNINSNDIFSNLNPLYFDNSVFDIYGSILNGAGLIPINEQELLERKHVIKKLKKFNVTIWFSVPSYLIYARRIFQFTPKDLPKLKKIIFGGEGYPKNNLKELFELTKNKIELFNVYGPTECTCICSSYKITEKDFSVKEIGRLAPIGKKLTKYFCHYLIDKKNNIINKNNLIGELLIGGKNVGIGYLNNNELNKEKFIFYKTKNKNNRFYKSGDKFYKDKNGFLYFAGRSDRQIKYNGYRIELDEIQNVINKLDSVDNNYITYGKKNNNNEITCWISIKPQNKLINTIKEISTIIPKYMMPKNFILKSKFPKNSNGKINLKHLSANYYDK